MPSRFLRPSAPGAQRRVLRVLRSSFKSVPIEGPARRQGVGTVIAGPNREVTSAEAVPLRIPARCARYSPR